MSGAKNIQIKAPYLIMLGDTTDETYAKTGIGLAQWRRELVIGQLRYSDCKIDLEVPDLTVTDAVRLGAKSLIIGVNPVGGKIPFHWWKTIKEAALAGLDIVSGLHIKLSDFPELVSAAKESHIELIDIRIPPKNLTVGDHIKRSGKRLLMVGTDCAIGKKYSALSFERDMKTEGMKATFRATGQTGIIIAGKGIPIDSVVADFISGAASLVSPSNDHDHWDIIEGQGSIFHPGYSGVSLGLLHGSQPDAFVVCHDAVRTISGEGHQLPTVKECIELHTKIGSLINPNIRCVGICVNTSRLSKEMRQKYLQDLSDEVGVPCVDPLIDGCLSIINHMKEIF